MVTPYVQNGATDSRQFSDISQHIYRFTPFEMSKAERDTLHAVDERMHVATFLRGIEFYATLVASALAEVPAQRLVLWMAWIGRLMGGASSRRSSAGRSSPSQAW